MRELKVMTLGRQLSLVHSSKNSSASFQSPAFSHALMRLLYVITLRSQPCAEHLLSGPATVTKMYIYLDGKDEGDDASVAGHAAQRSLPIRH